MKILLVTSTFDRTCDYIEDKYSDLDFFRLNINEFSNYIFEFTNAGFKIQRDNQYILSSECTSIYLRKPELEEINHIIDKKYHNFIHKESYSLIEGLIEIFEGKCLSKPSVMRRANNKIFQVMLVNKVGFNIPEFSISNDEKVLKQWSKVDDAIVKPLSIGTIQNKTEKEFVQTNKIRSEFDTKTLKYAPVYFQKYIEKDYEVRLTVVNGQFFPARIDSNNPVDWRKPKSQNIFRKWKIPKIIELQCQDYMVNCGMNFGCFDFLVKDDVWYFLEMNANGQWGWLDNIFNGEISDAIVNYLKVPYTPC